MIFSNLSARCNSKTWSVWPRPWNPCACRSRTAASAHPEKRKAFSKLGLAFVLGFVGMKMMLIEVYKIPKRAAKKIAWTIFQSFYFVDMLQSKGDGHNSQKNLFRLFLNVSARIESSHVNDHL